MWTCLYFASIEQIAQNTQMFRPSLKSLAEFYLDSAESRHESLKFHCKLKYQTPICEGAGEFSQNWRNPTAISLIEPEMNCRSVLTTAKSLRQFRKKRVYSSKKYFWIQTVFDTEVKHKWNANEFHWKLRAQMCINLYCSKVSHTVY